MDRRKLALNRVYVSKVVINNEGVQAGDEPRGRQEIRQLKCFGGPHFIFH